MFSSALILKETQMNQNEFYPPPSSFVLKMKTRIKGNSIYTFSILEPSAGKGDLLLPLVEGDYNRVGRSIFQKRLIDTIEPCDEFRKILYLNNFRVIGSDFLTFMPTKHYDLIFMNPPFSNGDKHLLKAIEILENQKFGQCVCILNAETIRNPFSYSRKTLIEKLNSHHAEIEFFQNVFSNSEHKTNVEIALISFEIEKADNQSIFDEISFQAAEEFGTLNSSMVKNELIRNQDIIPMLVQQYREEILLLRKFIESKDLLISKHNENVNSLNISLSSVKSLSYNQIRSEILKIYWGKVFKLFEFQKNLTNDVLQEFNTLLEKQESIEFNLENIEEVGLALLGNFSKFIEANMIEIFETITARHMDPGSKNRHYYDGWVTNDSYKIPNKIIIRKDFYDKIWKKFKTDGYNSILINDLIQVLAYFDGRKNDVEYMGSSMDFDGVFENEYFILTAYKKGTAHIKFKRLDLVAAFNQFIAINKNWMPPGKHQTDSQNENIEFDRIHNIIFEEVNKSEYQLFDTSTQINNQLLMEF